MSDYLRVTRIANLLTAHPEEKISRSALADAVDTRTVPVKGGTLTRLWPEVQARLVHEGLFLGRPLGRTDYGVAASVEPLLALLALENREKNVVSRLRNDVRADIMQAIVKRQGQGAVSSALQLERARAYLTAFSQNQIDAVALHNSAVHMWNALPWMTLTAADIVPWDQ